MRVTARTLILDLIAASGRGATPVEALVRAGTLFGFEANNVRVTLSKLCSADRVLRDERGQYRLAAATRAMSEELRGWRNLERELRVWHGHWIAIHCPRLGRGSEKHRRERIVVSAAEFHWERGTERRAGAPLSGLVAT